MGWRQPRFIRCRQRLFGRRRRQRYAVRRFRWRHFGRRHRQQYAGRRQGFRYLCHHPRRVCPNRRNSYWEKNTQHHPRCGWKGQDIGSGHGFGQPELAVWPKNRQMVGQRERYFTGTERQWFAGAKPRRHCRCYGKQFPKRPFGHYFARLHSTNRQT